MTTKKMNLKKNKYTKPIIQRIELDNEISLVLASDANPEVDPTGGPWAKAPEYFNNDPFKTNLG